MCRQNVRVVVEAWQSWGAGISTREGTTHSQAEAARRPTGAYYSEQTVHSGEKSSRSTHTA